MTVSVSVNSLGRMMTRGDAAEIGRTLVIARPKGEKESLALNLSAWLGVATLSAREIKSYGATVSDLGVASNVWTMQITGDGIAEFNATASDGRVWQGRLLSEETDGTFSSRYV